MAVLVTVRRCRVNARCHSVVWAEGGAEKKAFCAPWLSSQATYVVSRVCRGRTPLRPNVASRHAAPASPQRGRNAPATKAARQRPSRQSPVPRREGCAAGPAHYSSRCGGRSAGSGGPPPVCLGERAAREGPHDAGSGRNAVRGGRGQALGMPPQPRQSGWRQRVVEAGGDAPATAARRHERPAGPWRHAVRRPHPIRPVPPFCGSSGVVAGAQVQEEVEAMDRHVSAGGFRHVPTYSEVGVAGMWFMRAHQRSLSLLCA